MIYYIYREQGYKSLLPLNNVFLKMYFWKCIFSNGKIEKLYNESGKHKVFPFFLNINSYYILWLQTCNLQKVVIAFEVQGSAWCTKWSIVPKSLIFLGLDIS